MFGYWPGEHDGPPSLARALLDQIAQFQDDSNEPFIRELMVYSTLQMLANGSQTQLLMCLKSSELRNIVETGFESEDS